MDGRPSPYLPYFPRASHEQVSIPKGPDRAKTQTARLPGVVLNRCDHRRGDRHILREVVLRDGLPRFDVWVAKSATAIATKESEAATRKTSKKILNGVIQSRAKHKHEDVPALRDLNNTHQTKIKTTH